MDLNHKMLQKNPAKVQYNALPTDTKLELELPYLQQQITTTLSCSQALAEIQELSILQGEPSSEINCQSADPNTTVKQHAHQPTIEGVPKANGGNVEQAIIGDTIACHCRRTHM